MPNYQTNYQGKWNRKVSGDYVLELILHLTPKTLTPDVQKDHHEQINTHPSKRKYLTHKVQQQHFSSSDDAIKRFTAHAKTHQLKVVNASAEKRVVELSGKAKDFEAALGITLHIYEDMKGREYIEAIGTPALPTDLQNVIRYIALPMGRKRLETRTRYQSVQNNWKIHDFQGYSPAQIAEAYNFPEGDGAGECIGIIELGGTYKTSDIDGFFQHFGIEKPEIITVGVPQNDTLINDFEVTLDLQLAGALAPKAKLVIYYGHDIISAVKAALHDQKNKPSVLSISWAGSEFIYSPAQINEMHQLFYQAALMGITVIAASGDNGAYNQKPYLNVNLPAADPWVLACGGTKLLIEDNQEIIWNELDIRQGATGGGFSSKFPLPPYQYQAVHHYSQYYPNFSNNYRSRGVPDVAANADGKTGYTVMLNGKLFPGGGTSASTPVWAALIARLNQTLGHRLGFVNAHLYQLMGSKAFRQVWQGNNGYYSGLTGWNPDTGLGSPQGKQLLEALQLTQEPPPEPSKQTKKK